MIGSAHFALLFNRLDLKSKTIHPLAKKKVAKEAIQSFLSKKPIVFQHHLLPIHEQLKRLISLIVDVRTF
jgi:hypothetical protein